MTDHSQLTCASGLDFHGDVEQVGVAMSEPVLGQQLQHQLAAAGIEPHAHRLVFQVRPQTSCI